MLDGPVATEAGRVGTGGRRGMRVRVGAVVELGTEGGTIETAVETEAGVVGVITVVDVGGRGRGRRPGGGWSLLKRLEVELLELLLLMLLEPLFGRVQLAGHGREFARVVEDLAGDALRRDAQYFAVKFGRERRTGTDAVFYCSCGNWSCTATGDDSATTAGSSSAKSIPAVFTTAFALALASRRAQKCRHSDCGKRTSASSSSSSGGCHGRGGNTGSGLARGGDTSKWRSCAFQQHDFGAATLRCSNSFVWPTAINKLFLDTILLLLLHLDSLNGTLLFT